MINEQVTTIELTAGTPSTVEFSGAYPYYWVDNRSAGDVYASLGTPEADSDGTYTIAAGSQLRISGGAFNTKLCLLGSGKVQVIASGIAAPPFQGVKKGGGYAVAGASSYALNNAVDYPLLGLNLYGKSTQDGIPTPDSPVDIVSVGDNGFDIISKNDTHFNLLSVRDNGSEIITKQPVSAVGKNGETKQFIVSASGSGLSYQWWQNVNNGKGWTIMDTAGARQPIFSIPVATFRNGYKYRCVVTDSNGNSETSNEVTLYVVSDDCEITTASITASELPLCGIPVSSGGNYTDSSGQQWICDELIYNADGTGKIVKNAGIYTFIGNESFSLRNNDNGRCVYSITNLLQYKYYSRVRTISDKFVCTDTVENGAAAISGLKIGETCCYFNNATPNPTDTTVYFGSDCTTLSDFKSEIAGSRIIYPLAEPQEIELTAAEVDALRTLQTFDGTTSISNNSGAEMSVKYCTNKMLSECVLPITMGLQKQIDELRAAILSMGGNV